MRLQFGLKVLVDDLAEGGSKARLAFWMRHW